MIRTLLTGQLRTRFSFIRCDGDELLQARNLEDFIDRRLNSEDRKASSGRRCPFCRHHNDPKASGRNKGDFTHVEDDPWSPSAQGRADSRLQILAREAVYSASDTIHGQPVCYFALDVQFMIHR
jgi:hypothetical protein